MMTKKEQKADLDRQFWESVWSCSSFELVRRVEPRRVPIDGIVQPVREMWDLECRDDRGALRAGISCMTCYSTASKALYRAARFFGGACEVEGNEGNEGNWTGREYPGYSHAAGYMD